MYKVQFIPYSIRKLAECSEMADQRNDAEMQAMLLDASKRALELDQVLRHKLEAAFLGAAGQHPTYPNVPTFSDMPTAEREQLPDKHGHDSLMKDLAIKDALLRQMESILLQPLPNAAEVRGLDRCAANVVANARHREQVLTLKVQALTSELDKFRDREARAVEVNNRMRRRLRELLSDCDTFALRREVRTLRADLDDALRREETLETELFRLHVRLEAKDAALLKSDVGTRAMRAKIAYLSNIVANATQVCAAESMQPDVLALKALSARARAAEVLGEPGMVGTHRP